MHLPLKGIQILDLSWNIAGPATSSILADLGAEVWKVERIGVGDDSRRMAPLLDGQGAYFWAINRNKRSITVDLTKAAGRNLILRLATHCDVFIENFRHGKAEQLGLGPSDLMAVRPDLIYCAMSAYGDRGPDSTKAGYDAVLQARTGIMSITGAEDGPPVRAGVSILDLGSAMWAAVGILSSLITRQQTGKGGVVRTSLFETGVYWMLYHLMFYEATGQDPNPQGARHIAFSPYGAFQAADGSLVLGVSSDNLFARCCRVLGLEHLAADPLYATNLSRVTNRVSLEEKLNATLRQHPLSHWLPLFDVAGIPAAPIQKVSELIKDPQFVAIDALIAQPGGGSEKPHLPRLPLRFDGQTLPIRSSPPRVGEHSYHILQTAGFSAEEINKLVTEEVIGA